MKIEKVAVGVLLNNSYLVVSDKNNAVLIDPSSDFSTIDNMLIKSGATLKFIFLTHGHFDHIATAGEFAKKYGAKLVVSEKDAEMICDETKSLAYMFTSHFKPLSANILVKDGDELNLDELSFTFIETPGHSKGSVCILCKDTIFSGDTVLENSIGRTDFYGGDYNEIINSIKKIATLDENLMLLGGHGAPSTIRKEKQINPYFNLG